MLLLEWSLEENLGIDGSDKIAMEIIVVVPLNPYRVCILISVSAFIKNISMIYFYNKLYRFIIYVIFILFFFN